MYTVVHYTAMHFQGPQSTWGALAVYKVTHVGSLCVCVCVSEVVHSYYCRVTMYSRRVRRDPLAAFLLNSFCCSYRGIRQITRNFLVNHPSVPFIYHCTPIHTRQPEFLHSQNRTHWGIRTYGL